MKLLRRQFQIYPPAPSMGFREFGTEVVKGKIQPALWESVHYYFASDSPARLNKNEAKIEPWQ